VIDKKYRILIAAAFLLIPSYLVYRAGFLGVLIGAALIIIAGLVWEDKKMNFTELGGLNTMHSKTQETSTFHRTEKVLKSNTRVQEAGDNF